MTTAILATPCAASRIPIQQAGYPLIPAHLARPRATLTLDQAFGA